MFKKPTTPAATGTGAKGNNMNCQNTGHGGTPGSGSGSSRPGTPISMGPTARFGGTSNIIGSSSSSRRIPRFGENLTPTTRPGLSSSTSTLTMDKKNSAIHSSMEDLHRPKNYRKQPASAIVVIKKTHLQGAGDYGTSGNVTPVSGRSRQPIQSKMLNTGVLESSSYGPKQLKLGDSANSENAAMYEYIKKEKTQALVRKAVAIFIYGALKKQTQDYEKLQEILKDLTMQMAARNIRITFLLNTWRNQRKELQHALQQSSQLSIEVMNLELQLRVSKHLHATERDRVMECENEARALKGQLGTCEKSLKTCEAELSSLKEELRFFGEDREKLEEHKAFLIKELNILKEEKQALLVELEKNRQASQEIEVELKQTKAQNCELKRKSKEITIQYNQLQDKCKDKEAEGWEMKLNLERKNQSIGELEMKLQRLKMEYEDLVDKKKTIQDAYFDISEKLRNCFEENRFLHEALTKKAEENEDQVSKLMNLEESREKLLVENDKLREELSVYKLRHLHNRRGWVNTLGRLTFGGLLRLFFPSTYAPIETIMSDVNEID